MIAETSRGGTISLEEACEKVVARCRQLHKQLEDCQKLAWELLESLTALAVLVTSRQGPGLANALKGMENRDKEVVKAALFSFGQHLVSQIQQCDFSWMKDIRKAARK